MDLADLKSTELKQQNSIGWSIDYLEEIFKTEKFQNQFKIINERKDTEIKLKAVPYKNMS